MPSLTTFCKVRYFPLMSDWHPLVVHFPIALLTTSVGIELIALAKHRVQWHRFAYALLVAGLLSSAAAVITGTEAALPYRSQPEVADLIQQHEDLGSIVFVIFMATALGRLPLLLQRSGGWPLTAWIVVAVGGSVLLWWTSYCGGELVYAHGVGVTGAGTAFGPQPR